MRPCMIGLALAATLLGVPVASDTLEEAEEACRDIEDYERCYGLCVYYFQHNGLTEGFDEGDFWERAEDCHIVPEVVVVGQRPPPNEIEWPEWDTLEQLGPLFSYDQWVAYWPDGTEADEEEEEDEGPSCSREEHSDPGPTGVYTINVTDNLPITAANKWGTTLPTAPTDFNGWLFTVYCAHPETWKVRLLDWTTGIRWGARLLNGVTQVDVTMMSELGDGADDADCAELERMYSDLGSIPPPTPKYYMKQAVQAHEKLHVRRHKEDFQSAFATMKGSIEALEFEVSVFGTDPLTVNRNLQDQSLNPGIPRATTRFQSDYLGSVSREGAHSRGGYDESALAAMLAYRSMVAGLIDAACHE